MRQKYLLLSAESKNNLCPRLSKDEIDYENVSPIKKVETVESLKATLKHHHNIGTFVQSSQEFTFIGKLFQVIYSNFDTIYFTLTNVLISLISLKFYFILQQIR